MNRSEWLKIVAVLQARWPHQAIPAKSAELWFTDLEEFPAGKVDAAATALYRDGREFPPNGAMIRNKVIELGTEDRDWSKAYGLVLEAIRSHGGYEYGGIEWLREQDPVAAETAIRYGWRDFCYSEAPDTTRRAQFRDIYQEVRGSADRHERYRGIPAAGLAALEPGDKGMRRFGELPASKPQNVMPS